MTYSLSNNCTKNYYNRTLTVQVIVEYVVTWIFLRHSVYTSTYNKLCGRPPQYAPASHVTLTFDLLTLKVVSESRVTWATSVPILVFIGLSVLVLGPMYATDVGQTDVRQIDIRRASSLNAPSAGA